MQKKDEFATTVAKTLEDLVPEIIQQEDIWNVQAAQRELSDRYELFSHIGKKPDQTNDFRIFTTEVLVPLYQEMKQRNETITEENQRYNLESVRQTVLQYMNAEISDNPKLIRTIHDMESFVDSIIEIKVSKENKNGIISRLFKKNSEESDVKKIPTVAEALEINPLRVIQILAEEHYGIEVISAEINDSIKKTIDGGSILQGFSRLYSAVKATHTIAKERDMEIGMLDKAEQSLANMTCDLYERFERTPDEHIANVGLLPEKFATIIAEGLLPEIMKKYGREDSLGKLEERNQKYLEFVRTNIYAKQDALVAKVEDLADKVGYEAASMKQEGLEIKKAHDAAAFELKNAFSEYIMFSEQYNSVLEETTETLSDFATEINIRVQKVKDKYLEQMKSSENKNEFKNEFIEKQQ